MSQMLPKAGGQAQSAGFSTYGSDSVNQNSIGPGAPSLPQNQPPYSLNSLQQQQQQQQFLHRQQLQHFQQQQLHLQQQQQLQMGVQGASGTPILGSGGIAYRSSGGRRVQAQVPKYTQMMNKERAITPASDPLEAGGRAVTQSDAAPSLEDAAAAAGPSEGEEEKANSNLANAKEKTPMCLVNELARYNKVTHQYSLVDEQGPAHKKTFFVKLELDSEVYEAKGESIKKAQHAAAAKALEETKLRHPVPKAPRLVEGEDTNITPTVELNALAMKRGEPAVYKSLDTKPQQPYPQNLDFRGMFQQRFHYGGGKPRPFFVMLKVGQREFIGEGATRQTARHNAAAKALKVLRNLPMPSEKIKEKTEEEEEDDEAMKSEISLVHEIALKRSLSVVFEVIRESGPPHMKTFITKCMVGDWSTEAEGNSKKLSKKRAAESMLEELKKLPSLPPTILKPKMKPTNKKKNRNIIKVQKADPSYGVGVNPISRLIQIMQASKKKEPVYTLVEEKGLARRREFIMRCQVDEQATDGVGPNKKLAKRNAAEAMLQLLGYSRPSPQPSKPAIKTSSSSEGGGGGSSDKKVTFVDSTKPANGVKELSTSNSTGCQVVPGLIRLNQSTAANMLASSMHNSVTGAADDIASILSKAGASVDKQVSALAEYLKIHVSFEEFFKNQSNSMEFITRVTLATSPPHKFHGEGPTSDSARDAAALAALRYLLSVTAGPGMMKGAGDGNYIKAESLPRQLNGAGDKL